MISSCFSELSLVWYRVAAVVVTAAVIPSAFATAPETPSQDAVARLDQADEVGGEEALEIYEEIWQGDHPQAIRGRAACGMASILLSWSQLEEVPRALADGIQLLEAAASSEKASAHEWIPVERAFCHFLRGLSSDQIPVEDLGKALGILLAPDVATGESWRSVLDETLYWLMILGDEATDAMELQALLQGATRLEELATEVVPRAAALRLSSAWLRAVAEHRQGHDALAVKLLADATGKKESCAKKEEDLRLSVMRILSMEQLAAWSLESGSREDAESWARRLESLASECAADRRAGRITPRSRASGLFLVPYGAQLLARRIVETEYGLLVDLLGSEAKATASAAVALADILVTDNGEKETWPLLAELVPHLVQDGPSARVLLLDVLGTLLTGRLPRSVTDELAALVTDLLVQAKTSDPRRPFDELLLTWYLGRLKIDQKEFDDAERLFQDARLILQKTPIAPLGVNPVGEAEIPASFAFDVYFWQADLFLIQARPWDAERVLDPIRALLSREGETSKTDLVRARYRSIVGRIAFQLGKPLEAERHLRTAVTLLEGRPDATLIRESTRLDLVPVLRSLGKTEQAAAMANDAVETYRLWGPAYSLHLAEALGHLAGVKVSQDDLKGAAVHLAEAEETLERSGLGNSGLASSIRCFKVEVDLLMVEPELAPEEIAQNLGAEVRGWRDRGIDAIECQALAADFLDAAGRHEEAAAMIRDLLPRYQETYGGDHPWVTAEILRLAQTLARRDRSEAMRLFQAIKTDLRRTEGSSPQTLEIVEEWIEWLRSLE